jgi:hypothetical protein
MNYPFETYRNIDSFLEKIETNSSGHYPIGISSFWHSGIHVFSDSQKEFAPILNGAVVCYRISESYKQVKLPASLSNEDLDNIWSEYKDLYERGGKKCKIKSENSNKTYPISDCFILLRHKVFIDKKEYTFYTLYVNLAPKCDYSEYNENFIIDGKIHGSAINSGDEEFLIGKIGKPAKNKKDIYFDYILLSEDSIKNYSSKNGIKDFWNIDKNTKFYTRTRNTSEIPEKVFIPKWTEIDSEEYIDGDEKVYKNTIKSVQVYLKNSTQVSNDKLKDISFLSFSRGAPAEDILNPMSEKKYISDLIKNEVTALKGNKVDYHDKTTYWYIKVYPKQPIVFWTKRKISTEELTGNDPLYIKEAYKSNPLQYTYQLQIDVPDDIKNKVVNVNDAKLQGSDKQNYYQLVFSDFIDTEYYINETDKTRCYKALLDFDNWFYFYKESNSIICDKTDLVKEVINNHDNLAKKAFLLCPLIGIWWTGVVLTWTFIQFIFGKRSSAKESQGGQLTKIELRKVICKHPIEFDKEQFKDISKSSTISKEAEGNLVNEATAIDLWNGGLNKIFKGNPYYANPIYLINHFEKANLFEFNPYAGMKYCEIFKEKEIPKILGKNITEANDTYVESNPGFAPIYSINEWGPNINGYTCITGFFNQDYLQIKSGDGYPYERRFNVFNHEGLDFRGTVGAEIKSFIYGKVLGYGTYGTYGRAVFIRNSNSTGIFLLAHLSEFNKKILDKGEISPGDVVGKVGTSGSIKKNDKGSDIIDGCYDSHLHISFFIIDGSEETANNFIKYGGENIFGKKIEQGTSYSKGILGNPLNYNSKRKDNVSKTKDEIESWDKNHNIK